MTPCNEFGLGGRQDRRAGKGASSRRAHRYPRQTKTAWARFALPTLRVPPVAPQFVCVRNRSVRLPPVSTSAEGSIRQLVISLSAASRSSSARARSGAHWRPEASPVMIVTVSPATMSCALTALHHNSISAEPPSPMSRMGTFFEPRSGATSSRSSRPNGNASACAFAGGVNAAATSAARSEGGRTGRTKRLRNVVTFIPSPSFQASRSLVAPPDRAPYKSKKRQRHDDSRRIGLLPAGERKLQGGLEPHVRLL